MNTRAQSKFFWFSAFGVTAVLSMGASGCPSWVTPNQPPEAQPVNGGVFGPELPDGSGPAYYSSAYQLTFSPTDLQSLKALSLWGLVDVEVSGTDSSTQMTLSIPVRVQLADRDKLLNDWTRELHERSQWKPERIEIRLPQRPCTQGDAATGYRVEGLCLQRATLRIPRSRELEIELAWNRSARFSRVRAHSLTLRAPASGSARLIDTEANVIVSGGGAKFDLIAQRILAADTTHSDAGDFVAKMDLLRTFILDQIQGRLRVLTLQNSDARPYLRVDGKVIPELPFERP